MVKVVGLSDEEIREQERTSRLENITKQLLPEARVTSSPSCISVSIEGEHVLSVIKGLKDNYSINVYHQNAFQNAMRLAESYERIGEPEITVKKKYRE